MGAGREEPGFRLGGGSDVQDRGGTLWTLLKKPVIALIPIQTSRLSFFIKIPSNFSLHAILDSLNTLLTSFCTSFKFLSLLAISCWGQPLLYLTGEAGFDVGKALYSPDRNPHVHTDIYVECHSPHSPLFAIPMWSCQQIPICGSKSVFLSFRHCRPLLLNCCGLPFCVCGMWENQTVIRFTMGREWGGWGCLLHIDIEQKECYVIPGGAKYLLVKICKWGVQSNMIEISRYDKKCFWFVRLL